MKHIGTYILMLGLIVACGLWTAGEVYAAGGPTSTDDCYKGGSGAGYAKATVTAPMYRGGDGDGHSVVTMTSDTKVGYGTASKLSFTTQPVAGYAGVAFTTAPIVKVLDENDNTVGDADHEITLSLGTDPAGNSTFGGTVTMDAVNGVADFSGKGLTINKAGSDFQLDANSSPSLTPAVSSSFDVTAPVVVTAPAADESVTVDETYTITWTTYGSLSTGPYTLYLSTDGGSTYEAIPGAGSVEGTSYNWGLQDQETAAQCKVKIADTANGLDSSSDPTFVDESGTFALTAGLDIQIPENGEKWAAGNTHKIFWSTQGTISSVDIYYSKNGDSGPWNEIESNVTNVDLYSWSPTAGAETDGTTQARVKVLDHGNADIYAISEANFTIQDIIVTTPASGARWTVGTSQDIEWTSYGVDNVIIQWSTDDFATVGGTIVESTTSDGSYTWEIPTTFTPSTSIEVRVKSTTADTDEYDSGDAYAEGTSDAFTVCGTLEVTVPDGGEEWGASAEHDITWNVTGNIQSVDIGYYENNDLDTLETIVAGTTAITDAEASTGSYGWTPMETSSTLKIKITDSSDSDTYDVSDDYFSVIGFGITSPTSGVTWRVESSHNITWDCTGQDIDFVIIEYYDGEDWQTIHNNWPNNGTYEWTIPDAPTNAAKIRISDKGDSGTSATTEYTFNIAPTFTISSPAAAAEWGVGESKTIQWTTTGTTDTVKIEYYNGSSWNTVVASTDNDGSQAWTVADGISDSAKIRITDAATGHSTTGYNEVDFVIKSIFAFTSPTSASKWLEDSSHSLTWTSTGTVTNVKLEYSTDGESWTSITDSTGDDGTYSWTVAPSAGDFVTDPQNTPYQAVTLRVSDVDSGHPAAAVESDEFQVRWAKLRFLVSTPGGNYITDMNVSCEAWDIEDWSIDSPTTSYYYFKYGSSYFIEFQKEVGDETKTKTHSFATDSSPTWDGYTVSGTELVADQHVGVTFDLETEEVKFDTIHSRVSYDASTDKVYVHTWMEREGKIQTSSDLAMNGCTVTIYDSAGNTITTLTDSQPDANGLFTSEWSLSGSNIDRYDHYLARANIAVGGTNYHTSDVFDMGTPYTQSLQSDFRSSATSTLSSLDSTLSTVHTATSTTIPGAISDIDTDLATTSGHVASVLEDTGTTIPDKLSSIQGDIITHAADTAIERETAKGIKSEILERPTAITSGEDLVIRYRTESGLAPTIDIYDAGNNKIVSNVKMREIGSTGVYEYVTPVYEAWGDGDFTVICAEAEKSSMDSMMIDVEGAGAAAESAPGLEGMINRISADLSGAIDAALAKKGLTFEGAAGVEADLTEASKEAGYDDLMEAVSPPTETAEGGTISAAEFQNYVTQLQKVGELLQQLIASESEKPVVKTWYEKGSVKIKIVAVNPSSTSEQTAVVESYLPKEAIPADVEDTGGLELIFDYDKGLYKVHKEIVLAPKEAKTFEIVMRDVWEVPEDEIKFYAEHTERVNEILSDTEYATLASTMAESVKHRLEKIEESQRTTADKPEDHIAAYRTNSKVLNGIKVDIVTLEKLASEVGKDLGVSIEKHVDPSLLLASIDVADDLEAREVKLVIAVSNPSDIERDYEVKRYLPKDVEKLHVIDSAGLKINYDPEKELYYLAQEVYLKPGQDASFEVRIKDIWFLPTRAIENLRLHATRLAEQLKDTEYENIANEITMDAGEKLNLIIKSQNETMDRIDEHISTFYLNQERMEKVRDDLLRLERMVLSIGGYVEYIPEVIRIAREKDRGNFFRETMRLIFKGEAPKKGTTWKIIFAIISFLGVVSGLFYALWWMKVRKDKASFNVPKT